MAHTWRAEIVRSDGSSLTFADGDDVKTTDNVGLSEEPQVVLERNNPSKAMLTIRSFWAVPAHSVMSSYCTLWSSGAAGAVARGMHVRVHQVDSASGVEMLTFIGEIKRIEELDGRVRVTAYDKLMILGETKDPVIFFDKARDSIGDAALSNGPDIAISFNSDGQIVATLPDKDIVTPLMQCRLAEPKTYNDRSGNVGGNAFGGSIGGSQYMLMAMVMPGDVFYGMWASMASNGLGDAITRLSLWNAAWDGSRWTVGTLIGESSNVTIPNGAGQALYRFVLPRAVTRGKVYFIGFRGYSGSAAAVLGAPADRSSIPPELLGCAVGTFGSWTYRQISWRGDSGTMNPWSIGLMMLEERDIGAENYVLQESGSTTTITIAYGETSIMATDLSTYNKHLRVSYFYGHLSPVTVLERLLTHGGMSPSRAGSVGLGTAQMGFYNTANYSYLECAQELADFYDPVVGRQYTFACDHAAAGLDGMLVSIGYRHKPWADPIDAYTFSDDPMAIETNTLKRRLLSHNFKHAFEAKRGTVRVIGQAFDGSPVAVGTDDMLWPDSLVLATGSPLMDSIVDSTVTTGDQAARMAESLIREEHQNGLEGPMQLDGLWPSIWRLRTNEDYFGGSRVIGVSSPKYGMGDYPAVPRRMVIGGRTTDLELDNARPDDQTQIKRSMERSMASESFDVARLPDTVYIFARYANDNAGDWDRFDRMSLFREDWTYYYLAAYGTRPVRTDDSCAPDGRGYTHYAGFFPAHRRGGVSSYKWESGAASLHRFTSVQLGRADGSWLNVPLKPYYVWSHQNVLVDVYGRRPT